MDSVSQKHRVASIFHNVNRSSPSTLSLISFMLLPQEGHELVRARHPGSAKIEEFLVELGGLWEELRGRHRRNAVFLQASEELGFRVSRCDGKHCARAETGASCLPQTFEGRAAILTDYSGLVFPL